MQSFNVLYSNVFYQTILIIMLCPISVLLSFCYSFYVVLNTEWNHNIERMVSKTSTSATLSLNGLLTLWYQNKCWVWGNPMKPSLPVLHGSLSKWNKLDFDWLPTGALTQKITASNQSSWISKLITQEKKLLSHFFCTTQPSSLLTPMNQVL